MSNYNSHYYIKKIKEYISLILSFRENNPHKKYLNELLFIIK